MLCFVCERWRFVRSLGKRCGAACYSLAVAVQPIPAPFPLTTTMAYNDPYYSRDHQNGGQPTYSDGPEFDPYNQRQRHPTYDQSGYADDDGYGVVTARQPEFNDTARPKEKSRYDDVGFPPAVPPTCVYTLARWV